MIIFEKKNDIKVQLELFFLLNDNDYNIFETFYYCALLLCMKKRCSNFLLSTIR